MKIIYITDALAIWGGLERILIEKVNELTERYDYEMYLVTVNQGDHPIPFPLHQRVKQIDLDIQFHKQYRFRGIRRLLKKLELNYLYIKRLKGQINQIRPDVIVCVRSELTSAVIKAKGNIPLVYESHTSCHAQRFIHADWYERMKENWYNRSVRHAQHIVALTDGDAQDWREINQNVCVIPNMVHLNDGQLSSLENKRVIWVGRLDYQKRPIEMIKIWQKVYPIFQDWHLDIYGEGEQLQEIEDIVNTLNMNIYIHQPTDRIFDAYRESSVLASTSLFEPFGLVIPEAMSCGLPVVTYNSPFGPSSILSDGNDGFLIQNNDQQAFADRLCQLMSDGTLRSQMGRAASITSRRFEAKQIMPQWKTLFEQTSFSQEVIERVFLQKA